jgi:hypothetical protein
MHEALKQKLKECPVHVQRSEVEAIGEEVGLEGIEAAKSSIGSRGSRGGATISDPIPAGSPLG